ncbi:MAG: hypothetical protein M3457_02205 [Chloroflexota bacterium]|nr:hypothetical protein [Chloroflexota bacterium]
MRHRIANALLRVADALDCLSDWIRPEGDDDDVFYPWLRDHTVLLTKFQSKVTFTDDPAIINGRAHGENTFVRPVRPDDPVA